MKNSDFAAHPIFDKLRLFETRIHSQEAAEKIDLENIDFYRAAASMIRSQIDKSVTSLINAQELNDINALLDNSLSQINEFLGNGNIGHLANIEGYLFPAVKIARNFPVPNPSDNFSYSALINDLKALADQKIGQVNQSIDTVKQNVSVVATDINKREEDLRAVAKSITDKQTQIESLSQNFQANFDQIKLAENTKFEELRDRLKKVVDEKTKKIDEDSEALITRLEKKEAEANKLVNVIGNVGVTGNYQKIANEHRKSANNWRLVGIVFMTVLSIILIWTIWGVGSDSFDWKMALVRILSALVLTYPATYAVQESAKHRKLENENRTAELELASINPFIEMLDDEKKQLIKEKLVDRYFGKANKQESEGEPLEQSVPFKVLDKAVQVVKELKK